jgi:hypothetical protein
MLQTITLGYFDNFDNLETFQKTDKPQNCFSFEPFKSPHFSSTYRFLGVPTPHFSLTQRFSRGTHPLLFINLQDFRGVLTPHFYELLLMKSKGWAPPENLWVDKK